MINANISDLANCIAKCLKLPCNHTNIDKRNFVCVDIARNAPFNNAILHANPVQISANKFVCQKPDVEICGRDLAGGIAILQKDIFKRCLGGGVNECLILQTHRARCANFLDCKVIETCACCCQNER